LLGGYGGGRRAEGRGWRVEEVGGGVIFYLCLLPSGGAGCRSVGMWAATSTTHSDMPKISTERIMKKISLNEERVHKMQCKINLFIKK
jgi:hypothetical protein